MHLCKAGLLAYCAHGLAHACARLSMGAHELSNVNLCMPVQHAWRTTRLRHAYALKNLHRYEHIWQMCFLVNWRPKTCVNDQGNIRNARQYLNGWPLSNCAELRSAALLLNCASPRARIVRRRIRSTALSIPILSSINEHETKPLGPIKTPDL